MRGNPTSMAYLETRWNVLLSSEEGSGQVHRQLVLHFTCAREGGLPTMGPTLKFDATWNGQGTQGLVDMPTVELKRVGGYRLPRMHIKHAGFPFVFCVFFLSLCISTHSIPERSTMPSTERERRRKNRGEERRGEPRTGGI